MAWMAPVLLPIQLLTALALMSKPIKTVRRGAHYQRLGPSRRCLDLISPKRREHFQHSPLSPGDPSSQKPALPASGRVPKVQRPAVYRASGTCKAGGLRVVLLALDRSSAHGLGVGL